MFKRILERFKCRNLIITLVDGVVIYLLIRMIPSVSAKLDSAAVTLKDKITPKA